MTAKSESFWVHYWLRRISHNRYRPSYDVYLLVKEHGSSYSFLVLSFVLACHGK